MSYKNIKIPESGEKITLKDGVLSVPNNPITLNPCFFNRYAETDESTPPDIPTTTVLLDIFIFLLSIKIIFIRSIICNTKFVKY